MTEEYLVRVARQSLMVIALVSAPALIVSLVVGLAVSIIQATTQLQDHTLSFVPKLLSVLIAVGVFGSWAGSQLMRFTLTLFEGISGIR